MFYIAFMFFAYGFGFWLGRQHLASKNKQYKEALNQIIYYCERDAPIPAEKVAREALEG